MKLFLPYRKATLLMPSGPEHDPDRMHLFIVLTDPVTGDKLVLIASLCSVCGGVPYDKTCVLEAGEHQFIRHKSYIDYSKLNIVEAGKLSKGVQTGVFMNKGPMSEDVVNRIIDGVFVSKRTPRESKEFLKNYIDRML